MNGFSHAYQAAFLAMLGGEPVDTSASPARIETKRVVRYPGIVAAAAKLGVSRQHLYFVLEGQRQSPKLAEARRLIEQNLNSVRGGA
jgi:hypothetical protein